MTVQLRPYQGEAVRHCFQLWNNNVLNLLLIAAVGAGKTIIASTIMKLHLAEKGKRVLFLAHREELLEQTVEKLAMIDNQILAGIEQGRSICPRNAQVMVASIATVRNIERVSRWCPLKDISLVIIDECHHSTSATYIDVLSEIARHNPTRHLLGITATPIRMDGENLSLVFDTVAYRIDMTELIDKGFLCPIRGYTIQTNAAIENVPLTNDDDYDADSLAAVIDTTARNQVIVQSYLRHGEQRPAIAFVANVKHAEHLAAEFRRKGITAQAISGKQKKEERRQILKDYQDGKTRVLTNCNVLSEGYDAPHTACVIIGKPTRSPVVYPQAIGRGLRLHPSKRDCLVLDLVDIHAQNVITLPKIFRLPETLILNGENVRQVQRVVETARIYHPEVDWEVKREFTTADIRRLLHPPDFFHLGETIVPDTSTELVWMPLEKHFVCVVSVQENRIARVERDELGVWRFSLGKTRMKLGSKRRDVLLRATDALLPLITAAEKARLAGNPRGDGPPTEEQIQQLRQYQIPTSHMEGLTEAKANRLLQKLDFLKFIFRSKGQFQSGRYLGQYYEMVWFFDPDYIEAVAKVNKFIADQTQPLKTLQWLRKAKSELFETNLLPPFEELLQLCLHQPNRYHSVVRAALESSPEFLQMKTQFQTHKSRFFEKLNAEKGSTNQPQEIEHAHQTLQR